MAQPQPPSPVQTRGSSRATRTVAVLVLIPGIPLLLASVAALVLFYLAPDRLARLLAQLPGQEIIRTILFFAPVTLFAVVILAVLYARDEPRVPASTAHRVPSAPIPLTAWLLWITVPLLLISGAAWAARFIAPGRFGSLLDPLPGTTYLQWLVSAAPPLLLAIVVGTLVVHVVRRAPLPAAVEVEAAPWSSLSLTLAKMAAGLVLLPAIPLLLLSSGGLLLYYFQPDLLAAIAGKLSQATVLRLGVLVFPVSLLALIFLAGLTLVSVPAGRPAPSGDLRRLAAVGVLVGGLIGTMVVSLGLVGAVAWLLLR
ncbi:MAG: hypothetical protein AB1449_09910 [Chloroflexota bacterium]